VYVGVCACARACMCVPLCVFRATIPAFAQRDLGGGDHMKSRSG
jgi:Flp pilus assembly protein protease CpaA